MPTCPTHPLEQLAFKSLAAGGEAIAACEGVAPIFLTVGGVCPYMA